MHGVGRSSDIDSYRPRSGIETITRKLYPNATIILEESQSMSLERKGMVSAHKNDLMNAVANTSQYLLSNLSIPDLPPPPYTFPPRISTRNYYLAMENPFTSTTKSSGKTRRPSASPDHTYSVRGSVPQTYLRTPPHKRTKMYCFHLSKGAADKAAHSLAEDVLREQGKCTVRSRFTEGGFCKTRGDPSRHSEPDRVV